MPAHRIYLRGPWPYTPLAIVQHCGGDASPLPAPGIARMPASWQSLFGDYRGNVLFQRKFNRPSNLEDNERVLIVFEAVRGDGTVILNGHLLGSIGTSNAPQQFDVTSLLQGHEVLVVDLTFSERLQDPMPGGLFAPVVLEIVRSVNIP